MVKNNVDYVGGIMNAKGEILKLTEGEDILAISLGDKGWQYDSSKVPLFFKGQAEVKEALEILDFSFDSGYGGEEGYSLYVWTKTKVIVKRTYDGAELYVAIPRNPSASVRPTSIGG